MQVQKTSQIVWPLTGELVGCLAIGLLVYATNVTQNSGIAEELIPGIAVLSAYGVSAWMALKRHYRWATVSSIVAGLVSLGLGVGALGLVVSTIFCESNDGNCDLAGRSAAGWSLWLFAASSFIALIGAPIHFSVLRRRTKNSVSRR